MSSAVTRPSRLLRQPVLDASLLQNEPRVGRLRELHVVADDVVAASPLECLRDEVQAPRGGRKKCDLLLASSEKARRLLARRLDLRVPAPPVSGSAIPDVLGVGLDRVRDAARQGGHRGVIEIDEVPPHGKLVVESGRGEIEHPLMALIQSGCHPKRSEGTSPVGLSALRGRSFVASLFRMTGRRSSG